MKRDMDLARAILFQVEESDDSMDWAKVSDDGYSEEQISYHIKLLYQANLIEAIDCSSMDGLSWKATSLTWNGHEFLDTARNETFWNKAKSYLNGKGVEITIDTIKTALMKVIKEQIE